MMNAFGFATLLLLCSLPTAYAEEPEVSPRRARAALAQGLIKPLADLLTTVDARFAGNVVEAELHEEKGRWNYTFEILPANGRMYRVFVDATTGTVTGTSGPVQERR